MSDDRACFLTITALHALRAAAHIIYEAEGEHPYLVGSALIRRDFRDIDVRLPLGDDAYTARYLTPNGGDARWTLDCLSVGALMSRMTGLPVDYQPQALTNFRAQNGPAMPLFVGTAYAGGPPALTAPRRPTDE